VIAVSESFYRVPRPAVGVGSAITIVGFASIDPVAERERFEAQGRETSRSRSRVEPCYI
jgi:hypothetical protein